MTDQVRIGILGAARIAPSAVVRPARKTPQAVITAIAARNPQRAQAFASKHHIPRVFASYAELIADPDIDAIYNPLPNGLHCEWTIKALEAGKHVLCEKPFASNAAEAQQMVAAAERSGKVVMEAFHYRYHPVAERMREVVTSGQLGKIQHIETWMCFPLPFFNDIRYNYDLAGGALMDAGCYAVNMLRFLAGDEPEVVSAQARLASPQVDRWMRADMRFADGRTGRVTCALWSSTLVRIAARVRGELGEMNVFNPVMPAFYHHLKVRTKAGTRTERFSREATYTYQLRAFTNNILQGTPVLTSPADALANMRVIDAIYEKAGLWLRGRKEAAVPTPLGQN
jgi:predicted dehydrogenase